MGSFNPFKWTKKILFLTDSVDKNNKQLGELLDKHNDIIERLKTLETTYEKKEKEDKEYKDKVDKLNSFINKQEEKNTVSEKYQTKVDVLNDFMNQMKGRIDQVNQGGSNRYGDSVSPKTIDNKSPSRHDGKNPP